jgi:hypothetical protein
VAAHWPDGALVSTLPGHVTDGAVTSCTITLKVHWAWLFEVSVAVHVAVVVPTGKLEPDGGVHETLALLQLSVAVGVV